LDAVIFTGHWTIQRLQSDTPEQSANRPGADLHIALAPTRLQTIAQRRTEMLTTQQHAALVEVAENLEAALKAFVQVRVDVSEGQMSESAYIVCESEHRMHIELLFLRQYLERVRVRDEAPMHVINAAA
jgi:hypothetical protein